MVRPPGTLATQGKFTRVAVAGMLATTDPGQSLALATLPVARSMVHASCLSCGRKAIQVQHMSAADARVGSTQRGPEAQLELNDSDVRCEEQS